MEKITIGEIVAAISVISAISVFVVTIYHWYKVTFENRFKIIEDKLERMENKIIEQEKQIKNSKEERFIILNGLLACLKGLHNDLNCNGPVTKGINDIEKYIMEKSHE